MKVVVVVTSNEKFAGSAPSHKFFVEVFHDSARSLFDPEVLRCLRHGCIDSAGGLESDLDAGAGISDFQNLDDFPEGINEGGALDADDRLSVSSVKLHG